MKGVEPSGPRALSSARIGGGGFEKGRQVGCAQGIDHGDRFGIEGWQIHFVGERVRPFGSLIDPGFDGGDLFGTKRAGGRHLRTVSVTDEAVINEAVGAASRDDAAGEGLHHGASAIEAHARALLCGPMAIAALLAEYGQDVAAEINLGWSGGLGCGTACDDS